MCPRRGGVSYLIARLYRPDHRQCDQGEDHGNSAHGKQNRSDIDCPLATLMLTLWAARGFGVKVELREVQNEPERLSRVR